MNNRLLMATDVPYWRKSTGAEQRIASLVNFLVSDGVTLRTFFLGQSNTDQFTTRDEELIADRGLDVDQRSSDSPPKNLARKIGWYADATRNQVKLWTGSAESRPEQTAPATLRLADFRWPWAIAAFAETISEFKPDSILIEYIKLSYLLEAVPDNQRETTHCLVDTHDVLHLRCEQFRENGYEHWIEIDRETEANEVQKFDTIIAIQPQEADLFREMAPDVQTIVCGHATIRGPVSQDAESKLAGSPIQMRSEAVKPNPDSESNGRWCVGYLGSLNTPNVEGLKEFLREGWYSVQCSHAEEHMELLIAGGICEAFRDGALLEENPGYLRNVRFLGPVENLETFYDQIEIAINPIEFGTGLKIKNCEAIAFGKPVMTTLHGAEGMPEEFYSAVEVCCSNEEMAICLTILDDTPGELEKLQSAAQLSQAKISDNSVYRELKQALNPKK